MTLGLNTVGGGADTIVCCLYDDKKSRGLVETTTIVAIALCVIAVLGFVFFIYQKSKPLKVETEHGLKSETAEVVEKALETGAEIVDKASGVLNNVAEKAESVLNSTVAPLASGVGAILESLADRIKVRQKDFNTLKAESMALAQEVERLQNRQIDMTKVTAQLKLGLISISQQYSSWDRKVIEKQESGVFQQESTTEFITLHRANYETQVGLDLEKLSFRIAEDNRIQVFGLRDAEILGLKNLTVDPVIDEIRKFTSEGTIRSRKTEILENDSRLNKLSSDHQARVLKEIQENRSIDHLRDTNAKFAMAFLQACLSPGGFTVEESFSSFESPMKFGELCQAINKRINEQIDRKNARLLEIDEQSHVIEGEILQIVKAELQELPRLSNN